MHHHCDVGRLFFRRHTDALHFGREDGDRNSDTILHQHLRSIEIGAESESDTQCHVAVARALRRHIEHVLNAIDLLLDRRRHRFRYDLRVCAGISGRHLDRWWRNLRILRNRKRRKRDQADERDDDADNAGKDRPVDKKMREVHSAYASAWLAVILSFGMEWRSASRPFRPMLPPAPVYLSFGCSSCRRVETTFSPSLSPFFTIRLPSKVLAVSRVRRSIVLSGFTTKAYFNPCWELITLSSMSAARYAVAPATRTRTKKPGVMKLGFQFFKTMRARIVPVPGSRRLSTKSMTPSCGKSVSLPSSTQPGILAVRALTRFPASLSFTYFRTAFSSASTFA